MADWSQERGPFCSFQCYGAWQKVHTVGPANPGYRPEAHVTLECSWCQKRFQRRHLDHQRNASGSGRAFCSRLCFREFASANFQRQSYNWSSKVWKRVRLHAIRRDAHHCQDCQATTDLVVHHIRPFAEFAGSLEAHELDNLVTVCRACHRSRHNQLAAQHR